MWTSSTVRMDVGVDLLQVAVKEQTNLTAMMIELGTLLYKQKRTSSGWMSRDV